MKRMISTLAIALTFCVGAIAQTADPVIEKSLLPAPRQMKEGATVIRWKSDFTYDTLRKWHESTGLLRASCTAGSAAVLGGVHQHRESGARGSEPQDGDN
jgi:hypothetical protein